MRVTISPILFGVLFTAALPAAAQNIDHRASLGFEIPFLDVRHTSMDYSVPGANGQSTTTSVGTTTTDMGFNGAGLNGQYGLSNHTILGARLSFGRHTASTEGLPAAAQSQLSLLPRFEYYMAPDRAVRPHIGLEAGYERSTSNGTAGTTNQWLLGPTGGIAYFPSPNWSLDFNASLFLVTGSQSLAGASMSTGGVAFLMRVDLSSWFGGKAGESSGGSTAPTPSATTAPNSQPMGPNAASAPSNLPASATATPATSGAAATSTPSASAEPAAIAAQPAEGARLTFDLQEGRRLLLVAVPGGSEKKVKLTLIKAPNDDKLAACTTIELHAPNQDVTKFAVQYKLVTASSGNVSTLSAEMPADTLKPMTVAPPPKGVKAQFNIDHWVDVCGQNWPISVFDRRRLKDYLNGL